MAAVKTEISHLRIPFGARPFIPPAAKEEPVFGSTDARGGDFEAPRHDGPRNQSLPLKFGPIGSLGTHGRHPFDYRIGGRAEFQSNSQGGDQWKGKTGRYFMSVVPAAHALLEWAERETEPISQGLYEQAVGDGLTTRDREGTATDHSSTLNRAIRGFLSNCLSGEAQTIFKRQTR